jgi:bile acid:Na+ symporter, BASS family
MARVRFRPDTGTIGYKDQPWHAGSKDLDVDLVAFFYTDVIPVGLWIVMLGLGLALTPQDIKNIFIMPKAVSVGLAGQLILLPILAFGLCVAFAPTPAIAIGALVLAACPGGVTSNAYAFASRGDVALSVTLTAVTSFITIFTVPLITFLALDYFLEAGTAIDLPVGQMMWMLAKLTVVPVAIGMLIRHRLKDRAENFIEILRTVTFVFLLILIVTGSVLAIDELRQHFLQIASVVLSLNVLAMSMGFALGWFFRLPVTQRISITYEVGVQNISLASLVMLTVLQNENYFIVAVVYAAIMKLTAMGFMYFARQWLAREERSAAERASAATA